MKDTHFTGLQGRAKTRQTFSIGNFKGVDLTSPTFDVAANHAIQMQNFMRKEDVLEKREGLNHLYSFDSGILNIWGFKSYLIFHIGKDIVIKNSSLETIATFSNKVKDVKISAINRNGKLYIFGGVYLYILSEHNGSFTLTKAMDSAYIPTTTIGIGANNLDVSYDVNRQTYDDFNLLTPYHKNELTSGYPDDDDATSFTFHQRLEYTLDSEMTNISWTNATDVVDILSSCKLEIKYYENDELKTIVAKCGFAKNLNSLNGTYNETHFGGEGVILFTNSENAFYSESIYDITKGNEDNMFYTTDTLGGSSSGSNVIEHNPSDTPSQEGQDSATDVNYTGSVKVYGYIPLAHASKFYLCDNWGNFNILLNNVEITFYTKVKDSLNHVSYDYINHCTSAVLYTDTYSQNRVIVTGNPDYPNMDWRNEDLNVYALQDDIDYDPRVKANDLTYFPSANYATYGSIENDLVGYGLHADGKLLVFKQNSDEELASVYIREGKQVNQRYDNATGSYFYDYILDLKSSNKGAVPVNRESIVSYKGYIIFLGDNKKVNVVTNSDKSFATTLYAQPISHQIDKALASYTLEYLKNNAFLYVNNDYIYIVIGHTIYALIYEKTTLDEDYSFEYYILNTNILFEGETFSSVVYLNDKLLIGTSAGALFELKNSETDYYNDNRKVWLTNSEFTASAISNDKISLIEVGDYLVSDYYFAIPELEVADEIEANDYLISVMDYLITNEIKFYILDSLNEKQEVEVVLLEGTISIVLPENVEFGTDTHLYIKQSDNDQIRIKEIEVGEDDEPNTITYEYVFEDEAKETVLSALGETTHEGYIASIRPVNAYYITAPIAMNDLTHYKNIYSYTITNDTDKSSELQLSIISNAIPLEKAKEIGENISVFSFDLQYIDFAKISFAQDYIPVMVYTKYRNIFRQRFTDFVFYNRGFTNAILSKLSLVYTVTSPVVGGD